ncbi:MAG: BON domain-containing protein [Betaproteobacteria bacterium]
MKTIFSGAAPFGIGNSPIERPVMLSSNRRSGGNMGIPSFGKAAVFTALIVAGLTAGLGIGTVLAASDDAAIAQAHSDSVGAAISDSAITTTVKAKLFDTASLKNSQISVTTNNGVVALDGSASNPTAKTAAEAVARTVGGVKSVDNNLKIATSVQVPGASGSNIAKTESALADSWITTKVKSEILADSMSRVMGVSVETTGGVVVLKGSLANKDAVEHVTNIAGRVDGVRSVDASALIVGGK